MPAADMSIKEIAVWAGIFFFFFRKKCERYPLWNFSGNSLQKLFCTQRDYIPEMQNEVQNKANNGEYLKCRK